MTTDIYEVTTDADINVVATYAGRPDIALVDYVITYILKRAGSLLDEDLRQSVRAEFKLGKAHYMYFAKNGNVYMAK